MLYRSLLLQCILAPLLSALALARIGPGPARQNNSPYVGRWETGLFLCVCPWLPAQIIQRAVVCLPVKSHYTLRRTSVVLIIDGVIYCGWPSLPKPVVLHHRNSECSAVEPGALLHYTLAPRGETGRPWSGTELDDARTSAEAVGGLISSRMSRVAATPTVPLHPSLSTACSLFSSLSLSLHTSCVYAWWQIGTLHLRVEHSTHTDQRARCQSGVWWRRGKRRLGERVAAQRHKCCVHHTLTMLRVESGPLVAIWCC